MCDIMLPMIRKLVGLFVLCSTMYGADSNWIGAYVTNKVEALLSPHPSTVCSSIRYYRMGEVGEISISTIKEGDRIMVLVDIPASKIETNMTNSLNIVGYTQFEIPRLTNRPPTVSSLNLK